MVVLCCMCKKVHRDEAWMKDYEQLHDTDKIVHGYCPECAKKIYVKITGDKDLSKSGFGQSRGVKRVVNQ